MKITNKFYGILILALMVSGCATNRGPNENSGMIIGGLLGGALGNQVGDGHGRTVATVIGTIIGATIGGNVGRSMDDSDRMKVSHTLETVRTGVSTQWVNPDTNNSYQVKPLNTFQKNNSPCREYQIEADVEIGRASCRGRV